MKKYIPKNNSDELNPKFMYQLVATDLLVAIVNKQLDPVQLAQKELDNRGLDKNGRWLDLVKFRPAPRIPHSIYYL